MLENPAEKYDAFPALDLPERTWPNQKLTKPPRWLSTDLRDGNQALIQPMDGTAKMQYFEHLLKLGYKEIEISFPSASSTEYDFTRKVVTTPGLVPDDVWLQVMAPCRPDLIRKTIEAARGANKAIVHIYLSTSPCFLDVVLRKTEKENLDLAVQCTRLVRELTKDSTDPEMAKTEWSLEFTPENFQSASLDYALRICEAVKAAWQPTKQNPIILNLPTSVEMAMPNIFADQIEWFSKHITDRESVCISLHPHNDRGCAVSTAELAQLAGADRVEGCLFGNGERTGNVDLVTLAMNLYTQGVSPGVKFENINEVVKMVEELTKIPIHFRTPYAGKLVFCTFTGSHQDAIRKGYKARELQTQELGHPPKWVIPYLTIDPTDLGRHHEAVIRINSQSGKSGVAWYIKEIFGINLPRDLELEFSQIVKTHASDSGEELTHDKIEDLFRTHYMLDHDSPACGVKILDWNLIDPLGIPHDDNLSVQAQSSLATLRASIDICGTRHEISTSGEEGLACIVDAIKQLGLPGLSNHETQSIQPKNGPKSMAGIIRLASEDEKAAWGVGIDENPILASFKAALRALPVPLTAS